MKQPEDYTETELHELSDDELMEVEFAAKERYSKIRNKITAVRSARRFEADLQKVREKGF